MKFLQKKIFFLFFLKKIFLKITENTENIRTFFILYVYMKNLSFGLFKKFENFRTF
jgi:hypothetical protein